tara:strand:+ start:19 stop:447 length:429 start_codon:yes stop_codon:yes gene_type:complete
VGFQFQKASIDDLFNRLVDKTKLGGLLKIEIRADALPHDIEQSAKLRLNLLEIDRGIADLGNGLILDAALEDVADTPHREGQNKEDSEDLDDPADRLASHCSDHGFSFRLLRKSGFTDRLANLSLRSQSRGIIEIASCRRNV